MPKIAARKDVIGLEMQPSGQLDEFNVGSVRLETAADAPRRRVRDPPSRSQAPRAACSDRLRLGVVEQEQHAIASCLPRVAGSTAASVLPAPTTRAPAANAATTSVDVRRRDPQAEARLDDGIVASTGCPFSSAGPKEHPEPAPTEQPGSPARRPRLSPGDRARLRPTLLSTSARASPRRLASSKSCPARARWPTRALPIAPTPMTDLHTAPRGRAQQRCSIASSSDVAHVTDERLCQPGTVSSRAQSRCSSGRTRSGDRYRAGLGHAKDFVRFELTRPTRRHDVDLEASPRA
jgi:hypothetical protein